MLKPMRPRSVFWTALFLISAILALVACNGDRPTPTPTESPATATAPAPTVEPTAAPVEPTAAPVEPTAAPSEPTAVPTAAPTEPSTPALTVLPAAVYFISAHNQQVQRLERDGVMVTPITAEAGPVLDYDVRGDWLVYVVNNDLIALDLASGTRTVKVAGAPFDPEDYEAAYRERIAHPRIAPDGSRIAFARDGIQTVSLGPDATIATLLANDALPDFSNPDVVFPEGPLRVFNGADWSPDGARLVVRFGYYPEGGGLGLYDVADGSFVDLNDLPGDDPNTVTCCEAAWSADGTTLYITSDILVYGAPGVTRVDAVARAKSALVAHDFEDASQPIRLFRSALPQPDGSLLTFGGQVYDFGETSGYTASRVTADGAVASLELGPLNYLFLGRDILWAPDGSGVLLSQARYNSRWDDLGTLRWFYTDARLPLTLPISGHTLRWSGPPQAVTAEPDLAALKAQAAADFGVALGTDVDDIQLLRVLAADRVLYAPYSVGSHSWDPPKGHFVGLYEWTADAWQQLAQIDFADAGTVGDEVVYGPDYAGDLRQAYLNRDDIWLFLEGGVGAHGGLALLLRHDGSALGVAAFGFNSSPGAGYIEDVNGDGFHELILDETEPYVFCYACGVRLASYTILRWDGSAVTAWTPTPVTSSAVDAASRDSLNQALDLARAELWLDVESTLYGVDPGSDETAQFNLAYLRLTAAGRANAAYGSPFPLLAYFFYGDYASATFALDGFTPAEILDPNGPWLVGTVAEGFFEPWLPTIVEISSLAIAQQPDNSGAYFLRGWANYLQDAADASARADIAQAAALNPSNVIYSPVAAYLATLP